MLEQATCANHLTSDGYLSERIFLVSVSSQVAERILLVSVSSQRCLIKCSYQNRFHRESKLHYTVNEKDKFQNLICY